MSKRFPYAERAKAAVAAQAAIHSAFAAVRHRDNEGDPFTKAWSRAVEDAYAAIDAAYPAGFQAARDGLRKRDPSGIDVVIEFLEADPIFFRSGYQKETILESLKRVPLNAEQAKRLRAVVKMVVLKRDGREFRRYCRLAPYIDASAFRDALCRIAAGNDKASRRRAHWVLEALDGADRQARRGKPRPTRPTP